MFNSLIDYIKRVYKEGKSRSRYQSGGEYKAPPLKKLKATVLIMVLLFLAIGSALTLFFILASILGIASLGLLPIVWLGCMIYFLILD